MRGQTLLRLPDNDVKLVPWITSTSLQSSQASVAGVLACATCASPLQIYLGGLLQTHEQILSDFPELTSDDIKACLAYAAERLI
jgi:hypothetical protein